MYKTQAEVEAALAVEYSGPIKDKGGFSYVPAREAIKTMNDIFGPLGWSDEIVAMGANPESGIYTAAIKITVRFLDEQGNVVEVTRGDVGRSTADSSREEFEVTKNPVSAKLIQHDKAAASAATDAFSRASKKFGPALGSMLYDKEKQQSYTQTTTTASGDLGFRPSEKQAAMLRKNNIPFETMTGPQWKAALDEVFKALAAKREAREATF